MNTVLLAVLGGIVLLLFMILRLKIPAFIALLITSIVTALLAGMDPSTIMDTVKNGMASTLGFVATIIGLGAIFGGILEHSGGATILANWMLSITGEKRAPMALMITGFFVSIPIFFDVGFIILFPIIVALQQKTGKSLIHFAIPLLAGLAVTHSFIPPTPGPLAVAEIIGASLGMIMVVGAVVGLPTAYISGILYGRYIGKKLFVSAPCNIVTVNVSKVRLDIYKVLPIMLLPVLLIVFNTLFTANIISTGLTDMDKIIILICHPFSALIIANLLAWYILGRGAGFTTSELSDISMKSLHPAGVIILVTGAGGVFKQVLIDTGAGEMIASTMQEAGLSIIVFAFITATLIRVLQGSATVAMITAAGLVAPLLVSYDLSEVQLAALVISIASGATMASHLNDSGFWMVKEFMGLSEKDAIRTWTVTSTILGICGFVFSSIIFMLF